MLLDAKRMGEDSVLGFISDDGHPVAEQPLPQRMGRLVFHNQ
jgi:hypothetical protein